ncbi:uncharacterized protein LOC100840694 [Brachypodium distachyon]|uniref:uncharacterized protein LOC100840694 n=1 Tax=Brachypodium distachyon TaxID=15368 RepID=UPI000234EDD1|nr:uncharacterized protein LOC100840694 [Brachypodium distachyon]|eukprot:XP_003580948.1 uncharacterized protein LOC100840694 [Brachypodium distachyon]
MEIAISAVAGELVSQFISILMNKYHNSLRHTQSEEKVVELERLQHLLMRASTIIEEADARYITNSGMMMQLKTLAEAMYRGYRVLDNSRYGALQDGAGFDEVSSNNSSSSSLYLAKRSRTTTDKATRLESHGALESLEIAVANMAEFVVLLGGCERMSRRPYDVYLYSDNFMFGRYAEKQKLLSFLLQHNDPPAGDHALAILPIIGAAAVGKKTLVAYVCGDERVRSRFSTILHLNGDNLMSILDDHGRITFGMVLVVIEFASDVCDDDWRKFLSFVIRMGRGSKIIIVSRITRLSRFGSVKPIFLSVLSYDELRYLFKTLAFGSTDPAQHPQLVQIADEFAKVLHSTQGSLVSTNTFADVLRNNLDIQFWCCILDKGIRMVKRNLSIYGVHPTTLIQQGHPVDITDFASHSLSMTRYTINVSIKEELPSVTLGELLTDPSVRPKQDFILISWVSRMAPHNSFAHLVTGHAQDRHEGRALAGRKRRGVAI